ncbi:MAG: hypothetical protein KBS65_01230 [Prevotella sp.]|nr:hypothetical protein [Candidatus Equicola stercoris]
MKKVFLFMVVCLQMFIFTACNNDDDDNGGSESIVGTWYSYDMDDDEYNELSFNADGTGVKYENEIKNVRGKSEGEEIDYFAWKTSGDILYIGWREKGETKPVIIEDRSTWSEDCKFSISGDKLYLTYDYDEPGHEETVVFTRKK